MLVHQVLRISPEAAEGLPAAAQLLADVIQAPAEDAINPNAPLQVRDLANKHVTITTRGETVSAPKRFLLLDPSRINDYI